MKTLEKEGDFMIKYINVDVMINGVQSKTRLKRYTSNLFRL